MKTTRHKRTQQLGGMLEQIGGGGGDSDEDETVDPLAPPPGAPRDGAHSARARSACSRTTSGSRKSAVRRALRAVGADRGARRCFGCAAAADLNRREDRSERHGWRTWAGMLDNERGFGGDIERVAEGLRAAPSSRSDLPCLLRLR